MKPVLLASLAAIIAALWPAAVVHSSTAAAQPRVKLAAPAREPMVGQLMIKLRNPSATERVQPLGASRVAALSASAGVSLKGVRAMSGDATVVQMARAMTLSEANAVIARLQADPNVEWAAPDLRVRRMQTPPDTGYTTRQWNLLAPNTVFSSAILGGGTPKNFTVVGGANLAPAWASTQGASTVRIAVIDSGVTLNHPDLQAVLLPGYDFVSSTALTTPPFNLPQNFVANDGDGRDANPTDPGDWITAAEKTQYPDACDDDEPGDTPSSWHGTHMSGIAAAQWTATMPNPAGTSTAGIAPGVRVLPVRALGKCGGTSSDVIDAIRWSAGIAVSGVPNNANPAQVINLSLGAGSGACSMAFQSAVNDVLALGAIVVAATGNEGLIAVSQPANCTGVIGVTAHVINGDNADYSNVGAEVAISAPGGGRDTLALANPPIQSTDVAYFIWSTFLFGSTTPTSPVSSTDNRAGPAIAGLTGTSPATPHVAATAALLRSLSPALPPATVRELIQTSARAHPPNTYCTVGGMGQCGAGLLDAGAAVTLHNTRRPTIASPDQAANVGQMVALSVTPTANSGAGAAPFTYAWSQTGGAAVTLSNATAASPTFTAPNFNGAVTFSVAVTDNNGYRNTASKTVNVTGGATPPSIVMQPQSITVNLGQPATFSVTAAGTGPFTYQWLRNGVVINGATSSTYTIAATSALDNGIQFSVTVTGVGSVTSNAATLTVVSGGGGGGGGGSGAVPLWQWLLIAALGLARRIRRRD